MIETPAPLLLLLLLPFAAISTSMVAISPSMVASSVITLLLRLLLSFFPSRSEVCVVWRQCEWEPLLLLVLSRLSIEIEAARALTVRKIFGGDSVLGWE